MKQKWFYDTEPISAFNCEQARRQAQPTVPPLRTQSSAQSSLIQHFWHRSQAAEPANTTHAAEVSSHLHPCLLYHHRIVLFPGEDGRITAEIKHSPMQGVLRFVVLQTKSWAIWNPKQNCFGNKKQLGLYGTAHFPKPIPRQFQWGPKKSQTHLCHNTTTCTETCLLSQREHNIQNNQAIWQHLLLFEHYGLLRLLESGKKKERITAHQPTATLTKQNTFPKLQLNSLTKHRLFYLHSQGCPTSAPKSPKLFWAHTGKGMRSERQETSGFNALEARDSAF